MLANMKVGVWSELVVASQLSSFNSEVVSSEAPECHVAHFVLWFKMNQRCCLCKKVIHRLILKFF